MNWVSFEIKQQSFLTRPPPPPPRQFLLSHPRPPPPINLQSYGSNLNNKVSPSILLILVILAIIFFISGLLHLLIRFILRPQTREPDDLDDVTALQGQLQQLFHLHDSGVDQSYIDTLPIFNYRAITGVNKDPFDCAVCLCEFEPQDKLRLLPKCSHAFHMECIDTWLLSHSTCPLCRSNLLSDLSPNHTCSPLVLVLESGGGSSREIISDRDDVSNSHLGFHNRDEFSSSRANFQSKSCEIEGKEEGNQEKNVGSEEKIVTIKLGKFRNVDGGGEGCSDDSTRARRCFSMGSFAYVMDETSSLQVPIRTPMKKSSAKKPSLPPLTPGHRPAMSECDCESRRDFNGLEPLKSVEVQGNGTSANGRDIGRSMRESISISKIWLRAKKEKPNPTAVEPSRRASSFRFPVRQNEVSGDDLKTRTDGIGNRRTVSEIGIERWVNREGSELGCDEENQSRSICVESQTKTQSFARTLLWLVGKQNKVVHSSLSSNL